MGFAYQGLFDSGTGGLRPVQDYVITHSSSAELARTGAYPSGFFYPLPFVVMKLLFAAPGIGASSVAWMALLLAAACAVAGTLAALLGPKRGEHTGLPVLIAFGAALYCVQWDFRAMNANLIFLALVLGSRLASVRGRAAAAGFLLASSLALKLVSAVLLPYLLLRGKWRELAHAGAWVIVYFALIPAVYFGPADALELTRSWLAALAATSRPEFPLGLVAYQVSLHRVLIALFCERGADPSLQLASLPLETVHGLTRAFQLLWATCVGAFLFWTHRRPCPLDEGVTELVDTGLLLMTMALLSPLLQPHHGVVLLVPAAVLADVALRSELRAPRRILAAGALVLTAAGLSLAPAGTGRGVALNATLLVYSLTLAALRADRSLDRR